MKSPEGASVRLTQPMWHHLSQARDVNEARHLEAKARGPRPRPRPESSRPRLRSRPEVRGQGRERGPNGVQKYHGPKTTTNNTQFDNQTQ